MTLHESAFGYLKPTNQQQEDMTACRNAAADYAEVLDKILPEGPDKTYVLRRLREVAMWADVTITRQADGAPRA